MTPNRPIMRYHGGKWKLADWIISSFPPHRVYVEPYGGGANVMAKKVPSKNEIYNDTYDQVVNVFRVLRDPEKAKELARICYLTPYSRSEFFDSYSEGETDIENARRTIFRSMSGFGSGAANHSYKTGFRGNANRDYSNPSHDWKNYPPVIMAFCERFRGVIIENMPALYVISKYDYHDALFYVDPPYLRSTRNTNGEPYHQDMDENDHIELAECLNNISGMAIISGYPSALYKRLYKGWTVKSREAYTDSKSVREETIWINPKATLKLSELKLF